MSYADKKQRIFMDPPRRLLEPIRSEGRMKQYSSTSDVRAWCGEVESRRQHIIELSGKSYKGYCPGEIIPLDVIMNATVANKNKEMKELEKKEKELNQRIQVYESAGVEIDK